MKRGLIISVFLGLFLLILSATVFSERVSAETKTCPSGYADRGTYCIGIDYSADYNTWAYASSYCVSQNARLCSSGEWQNACQS